MSSESKIQRQIMLYASNNGSTLFRNNVGKCWIGKSKKIDNDVLVMDARRFNAGLCQGSSDLIGWTVKEITPDMVGQKLAVFTAIECKSKTGKATKDQTNFLNAVNDAGGLSCIARCAEDLSISIYC